jgi:hypothetical protein
MSSDGEWVATSSGEGIEVIPTRRQEQTSKVFPYRDPCFAGPGQDSQKAVVDYWQAKNDLKIIQSRLNAGA